MTENLLGWHQFGGRIIPRRALMALTAKAERSSTRLQVGQAVKVKITDQNVTSFADAIVLDFHIRATKAVSYTLAFAVNVEESFYLVVEDFNGAGGWSGLEAFSGTEESAAGSCIFTLEEYATYLNLDGVAPAAPTPARGHLRVINGV
jgi:hypothetical protein